MNKKTTIFIFIGITILALLGGTFAYWNWQSTQAQKTDVTFTVASTFSCSADGGGDITSNTIQLIPASCTNSNYAIKRTVQVKPTISNGKISLNLWLNIDDITTGLSNSTNFKYALTKNSTSCSSDVIARGSFNGKETGDTIQLLKEKNYSSTTTDTYYLYIWLDYAEESDSTMNQSFKLSLGGVCTDEIKKASYAYLGGENDYYKSESYKDKVRSIKFVDSNDYVPTYTPVGDWTFGISPSEANDVYGVLEADGTLYIVSDGVTYIDDLSYAFYGLTSVEEISFDNLNTSGATTMQGMFRDCSSLSNVDVNSLDTSEVTNMDGMFYGCASLTTLDLYNFDTSNTRIMSGMFMGSGLHSIDVSSFDTSYVNEMNGMFHECTNLTELDLSSFDTSNVTKMSGMFSYDNKLQTIYISDRWNVTRVLHVGDGGAGMFTFAWLLTNGTDGTDNASVANCGPNGVLTCR